MLDFSVTFFISFLNIAILYFILRKLLFRPVTAFMENRSSRISAEIENAAKTKAEAENLRAAYEERLRSADADAEKILRSAREESLEQRDAILKEAKREAEEFMEAARRKMEDERKAASAAFRQEAADLVLAATGKLLKREILDEDSRRASAALVAELGK